MKNLILVVGLVILVGITASAQMMPVSSCNIDNSDRPVSLHDKFAQDFPGLTLKGYGTVVEDGMYRGSRPSSDDDFRYLKAIGIKNILTLEIADFNQDSVEGGAAKYGMHVEIKPIQASPIEPSTASVEAALNFLSNQSNWPVYIHCNFGYHRTGMLVALYRVRSEGCSLDAAKTEMEDFGYNPKYVLVYGLMKYLNDYATQAPTVSDSGDDFSFSESAQ